MVIVLTLLLPSRQPSKAADPPLDFEQLAAQLDSDSFADRQAAERTLRQAGVAALPTLEQIVDSPSAEVRSRARRISQAIQDELLVGEFETLAIASDEKLDIERGMVLVARIGNPLLRSPELLKSLDELAERVGDHIAPRKFSELPAREAVEALCDGLFVQEGFTGNAANYDDPANSSLEQVLTTRKGLPIMLSHVMIAVGRRHGLPLRGLPIPGRYMVKYDAPRGHVEDEMVIDPYAAGKIYTFDELEDVVAGLGFGFDHATHLTPATPRDSLARMLRNLADDFRTAGRPHDADRTQRYLRIVLRE